MMPAKRLFRAWTVLERRGLSYLVYFVLGFLLPRLLYHVFSTQPPSRLRHLFYLGGAALIMVCFALLALLMGFSVAAPAVLSLVIAAVLVRKARREWKLLNVRREARMLHEKARMTHDEGSFTSWASLPVDQSTREAVERARQAEGGNELTIGRIDWDIRVLGLFGHLPILPPVTAEEFLERPRFRIDVVLVDGKVLVRKDFRGDRVPFLTEWRKLAFLYGKANVPAIYRVDEDRCVLYKNLIFGQNVRDILVRAGARIMYVQTRDDPELAGLDKASRLARVVARGAALVPSCLPESLLWQVEQQIEAMHRLGVTHAVPTFGNVVVEHSSGLPWFVDLEGARLHRSTRSFMFRYHRDRDREKFNQRFARGLITESSARSALVAQVAKVQSWYAPIDFGGGLAVGGFWSTDSGTGRWEFLNEGVMVPLVGGKRILDLGSNNGILPMMMLRAGARQVIGLELSSEFARSAQLVHRIFEWRDMREYAFQIHNCDMLTVLREDWGLFDIVTSFCSLYYLSPEDMARVIRRAAQIAPLMVIQANEATRREAAAAKAEKSSLTFLRSLLEENGFPEVEVYAPKDYSRPLLVGRAVSKDNKVFSVSQSEQLAGMRS